MWVVEAVVADHGVQGQDTVVGQGEDGLVVTFPLLVFALVVGPGDGGQEHCQASGFVEAGLSGAGGCRL